MNNTPEEVAMDKDLNINDGTEGTYDILQNAAGEILVIIRQRRGGPENPRFVYDGGETALLYRSRESSVFLGNINIEARNPLKIVDEILVAEIDGDEVAREYMVPVRIVRDLKAVLS
ncbi:MAG: hypothetical protein IJV97_03115 [Alphaproteobacteria bacterium]|nr:hypothetical protein [Alphaproteobacteria bacterium]